MGRQMTRPRHGQKSVIDVRKGLLRLSRAMERFQ